MNRAWSMAFNTLSTKSLKHLFILRKKKNLPCYFVTLVNPLISATYPLSREFLIHFTSIAVCRRTTESHVVSRGEGPPPQIF